MVVVFLLALWMGLSSEAFYVVVLIAIAKGFEAMSDIYYGLLYKYERMRRVAASLIIKGFLSFIVFALLFYTYDDVVVACAGMTLVWGLVFLLYDSNVSLHGLDSYPGNSRNYVLQSFINIKNDSEYRTILCRIVRKALPLGMMGFLVTLSVNIPRYVIEWSMGVRELGYYAAISYIMLGGVMIMSAIGQSVIPRLSMHAANKEMHEFKVLLIKAMGVAFAAGIFGCLFVGFFGRELLLLLYGEAYAEYTPHLQVIMYAALLNYMAICFWYALTALQSYWSQFYLFMLDVCIITAASISLVPGYGIMGAIYAVLLVMIFHFVAGGMLVGYKISERAGR
jgi:O-antigen/teichoic acid export membrane protein